MNMMNDKRGSKKERKKERVLRWKLQSPKQQDMRSRGFHNGVKLGWAWARGEGEERPIAGKIRSILPSPFCVVRIQIRVYNRES